MDALKLLTERYSEKKLSAPAPDKHQLTQMFQAALRSPDHGRLQPYRFIVIEQDKMTELSRLLKSAVHELNLGEERLKKAENLATRAPMIIGVVAKIDPNIKKVPEWEQLLCAGCATYAIQLAYLLYVNSGRTDHLTETVRKGLVTILDLWRTEQDHAGASPYRFVRDTDRQEDTLPFDGKGSPVGYTGMTWSGFRPSDDRCTYHYLVPSNQFASVVLGYVAELAPFLGLSQEEIQLAATLKDQIQAGIERYGIIQNAQGQAVYAYEVDGLGNASIMDDGNVPNLLSLPYLGFCSEDDPIYVATRQTVLSPENPYYYSGKLASGLGSSHTWDQYIWPISLSMEGLTTSHKAEKARILDLLVNTDAGTNQMHESFHVDDDSRYTREWFSWSNMMFCELLLDYFDIRVKR